MDRAEAEAILDPAEYPKINRRFYMGSTTPHGYLNNRLRALLLATSNSDEVKAAHQSEFKVGVLTASYSIGEELSDENLQDFSIVESTVLVHHAAETLVRLYLAHVNLPACPWIEAASLRKPGLFPKQARQLRARLHTEEAQESLMEVFTGARVYQDGPGQMPRANWEERREGLQLLMDEALERVLEGAPLYNSAKHGLTVKSGNVAITFDFPKDAGIDLSADGPAMSFLERVTPQKRWGISHAWISASANTGLTFVICRQIEDLWALAAHRYVEPQLDKRLHTITPEIMEAVMQTGGPSKTFTIKTMTEPLVYLIPVTRPDGGADAPLST